MRYPSKVFAFNDATASREFRAFLACDHCPEANIEAVWNRVRDNPWGELNVRTGEAPVSRSQSITTGIKAGFNPDDTPPYKPEPLNPGDVVVIWEHRRLSPGSVLVKIRRS